MYTFSLCVLLTSVFLYTNDCEGLTCFNCPGIRHPQFCGHVQECSEGQVCGVERLEEKTGEIIYNSGCMSHKNCYTNTTDDNKRHTCYECCSSDLCNTNGCGEQGLSKTDGTVCYNCQGVFKPEECHSVAFCGQLEVCDALLYNSPIIGRRSVGKRSTSHMVCCDESLCNSNSHLIGAHTTIRPNFPTSASSVNTLTTTRRNSNTDRCPDGFVCLNDGVCEKSGQTFTCTCMDGFFGDYCQYTGSKHATFNLIYPTKYFKDNLKCKLLVASRTPVSIKHQLFTLHTNTTVTFSNGNYSLELNTVVYNPSDGVGHHGVEVFSNDSTVNVYGYIQAQNGNEGYFAIPARFQSTKYIISSFTVNHPYGKSYIAISPLKSNTVVHVHLQTSQGPVTVNNVNYTANSTVTMLLSVHDTFQLSHEKDLTGTLITASDPIVVVSGSRSNTVGPSNSDINPLMEMLLPIDHFDTVFIIPTIAFHPMCTVRLLAVNTTNITINNDTHTETKTLQARQYYDFKHEKVSHVRASEAISVMIYPHGNYEKGDVFMMTIHGINQYLTEYTFAVPAGMQSYLSITVQTKQLGGFYLDGKPLTLNNVYRVVSGSYDFETGSSPVTAGVHTLKHSGGVKFGLWIYGRAKYNGYGYPAGISLKNP